MRILFITAFYPPYLVGGWEQLVQDINIRLQARGHVTRVLTSNYGTGVARVSEPNVERVLELDSDLNHYRPLQFFWDHKRSQQRNLRHTQEVINAFDPDVVFVHVMWNLTRAIPWLAEQLRPGRVIYYMADAWPYTPDVHTAYWQDPAASVALRLPKRLLATFLLPLLAHEDITYALNFDRVLCVSQAIKNNMIRHAGMRPDQVQVVYNGIDLDQFAPASHLGAHRKSRPGLSLLYAGSLVPHKGVHTAIKAMTILAQRPGHENITLTIVGAGHPDYEASLRAEVSKARLAERISFRGRVPREDMPRLLLEFDVLVFPSIWEEPLARMTQEAMAMGLVVVGTTTGGTGEILIEGETGLTFEPGDAATLANRIEQLDASPELRANLARNAYQLVTRQFDIRRMIDEIEGHLSQVARSDNGRLSILSV